MSKEDSRGSTEELQLELSFLKEENKALRAEIERLRSSGLFRLRQRLLPEGSLLQRLFFAARTGTRVNMKAPIANEYHGWIRRWDTPSDDDRAAIKRDVELMVGPPLISVVLPVFNPPEKLLVEAIESVRKQIYTNWELCISDDASTEPYVQATLERFAAEDSRIRVHFRPQNGHISLATNDAIAMANGAYVGFLDHDDTLAEHALYSVAKALEASPAAKFVYSDEDKIDADGGRFDPAFKPDWDPLLLLSGNYTCHFSVYEVQAGKAIGWLRQGVEGAQDWDFVLRFTDQLDSSQIIHIPHVLYHWRAHPQSTAGDMGSKPYVRAAQQKVVEDTLKRRGERATATRIHEWGVFWFSFRVDPAPKVSVVIRAQSDSQTIAKSLTSLFGVTDYSDFETIFLEAGDTQLEAWKSVTKGQNIRLAQTISEAEGEVLAFLSDDLEILEPQWMQRLAAVALRPEVGAVGPRLLSSNGLIQSGGLLLDSGQVIELHAGLNRNDPGYMARAMVDHGISALDAACLFVRRGKFEAVGGFDDQMPAELKSVDLCLRLESKGNKCAYLGSVTCMRHGNGSRPSVSASPTFLAKWQNRLQVDPYYNPNLSVEGQTYLLADVPRAPQPWRS